MTPMDDLNRMAVQGLLADADRILALTDLKDVRGDRAIVDDAIANAQRNYVDLVRRRGPLLLTAADEARLQNILDQIRTRIRLYCIAA
ncbi:MAG: hypothetical protein WAK25_10525 [Acidobacteriaceae bacterium]